MHVDHLSQSFRLLRSADRGDTSDSCTSQRGSAATPRPLATSCIMMSVFSTVFWLSADLYAGSRTRRAPARGLPCGDRARRSIVVSLARCAARARRARGLGWRAFAPCGFAAEVATGDVGVSNARARPFVWWRGDSRASSRRRRRRHSRLGQGAARLWFLRQSNGLSVSASKRLLSNLHARVEAEGRAVSPRRTSEAAIAGRGARGARQGGLFSESRLASFGGAGMTA
jgi:hypothetical protein